MHFPTHTPQYISALFRMLIKNSIPFVFSKASATFREASIPEEMDLQGLGLICNFVPQQEALCHPSTGAFVTHGGANSMWECILAGVVGVYWPIFADQPQHAAYLSTKVGPLPPKHTSNN